MPLLFLFVIRNVFHNMDFLVVVALFPFFNVLSILCEEMSALDSLTLHFSFRFSQSGFVFTAIFELFVLVDLSSGKTLFLDNEINRLRPIFQGWAIFPRNRIPLHSQSTSFEQLIGFKHKISSCIFISLRWSFFDSTVSFTVSGKSSVPDERPLLLVPPSLFHPMDFRHNYDVRQLFSIAQSWLKVTSMFNVNLIHEFVEILDTRLTLELLHL